MAKKKKTEPPAANEAGGGGDAQPSERGETLLDPKKLRADLNMVGRAVRERWPIPPGLVEAVTERMTEIVKKPTVSVMTKEGLVDLDGPADSNAVKAAAVIVAMSKQNQDDDHLADKNQRLDEGKATERVAMAPVVLREPV